MVWFVHRKGGGMDRPEAEILGVLSTILTGGEEERVVKEVDRVYSPDAVLEVRIG